MPKAALLVLAFTVAVVPVTGVGAETPPMQVEVVKTKKYIRPFGDVAWGATKVILRLHKRTSEGTWRRVSATRTPVEDELFKGQLHRPRRGLCRIKAIAKTDSGSVEGRAEEIFGCEIPPFGDGQATLASESSSTELDVWIADDHDERSHGLMYRKWMPESRGMVFLFPEPSQGGFYMLNTHLPLSIAFFDSEGVIVDILDMEPCPDEPCPTYTPDTPYTGALEVNQGAFETWGITEGDRITVNSP